ncbi:hypothetical protein L3V83_08155 [Thiotrichales bacterium 19X7-9]|nr:hypothetical protein [Thiotrichales bacterium 19X7-9]
MKDNLLPIFDGVRYIEQYDYDSLKEYKLKYCQYMDVDDANQALQFLKQYIRSEGTYNSYRREIERLLHWSWLIANKSLKKITSHDIQKFIKFCLSPTPNWVGMSKIRRFINVEGKRIPNASWRPFVIVKTKYEKYYNLNPDNLFKLSNSSMNEVYAILSTFYNFLLKNKYVKSNHMLMARFNKDDEVNNNNEVKPQKSLSDIQLKYILKTSYELADINPTLHERTYFLISLMYHTGVKVTELSDNHGKYPKMNDVYQKNDDSWYFKVLSKYKQYREIPLNDEMILIFKRWRKFLGLNALPKNNENIPLILKTRGRGPVNSEVHIRRIIQKCFDESISRLSKDGYGQEANELIEANPNLLCSCERV